MAYRGSDRLKLNERMTPLDEATRNRRLRKFLELMEADNYHQDPHGNEGEVEVEEPPAFVKKLAPQGRARPKKPRRPASYYKEKYNRTLQQMVTADQADAATRRRVSYLDAAAEDSKLPPRHFCGVCGFEGPYVCLRCGVRYCSLKCMKVHMETRCIKWLLSAF